MGTNTPPLRGNATTHLLGRTRMSRRGFGLALVAGAGLAAVSGRPGPLLARAQGTPAATPVATGNPVPLGDALGTLAPEPVWRDFAAITQIPRPSHHEERISAYLAQFGRDLGLETLVDDLGNVLIRKPATPGMDDRPGVVLQAHMDMVPEKTTESRHDFLTDPIDAVVDGDWVRAEGTTLGADNGIGVALILAILQADDVAHGPLEALFTVNEEDGLTGANGLSPDWLRGTMLINVDSEEEGAFTIGSAGGVNVDATATYAPEPTPTGQTAVRLHVGGLQGGHSGIDIDRGRGNAAKLLARLLATAGQQVPLRLATFASGERHNAIPRDAEAVVTLPASQAAALDAIVRDVAATVQRELAAAEPELTITSTPVAAPATVMPEEAQRAFLDAVHGSPNGVIRMSDAVPGLVETSLNLGIAKAGDGSWTAGFLVRSAIDSERDDVAQMVVGVFDLAGATSALRDAYSGWTPNPDSPLLNLMQQVYRDEFGHDATVMAIHAGLETSVIGAKYPGMDMISVGPTLQNVHSPDERLEIATVGKAYDLLVATLARIPAKPA